MESERLKYWEVGERKKLGDQKGELWEITKTTHHNHSHKGGRSTTKNDISLTANKVSKESQQQCESAPKTKFICLTEYDVFQEVSG